MASSEPSSSKAFDISLLQPPARYEAPAVPQLPQDTAEKIQKITQHFSRDGFELPINEDKDIKGKARLSEREMMFLSRETFTRFLTATKGDVDTAIKRLEDAVVWRRTVSIEDVEAMAKDCEPEKSRCGKNYVMGWTPQRRPIIYFFPNRNTTPVEQRRAVHAIFLLERARDLMPEGTTAVTIIFNFAGKKEGPPTNISVARQVLHILSAHYPETLACSVFQDMHWAIKAFISLMWPFVDPNTKKKVKFVNTADKTITKDGEVDADQLASECGGDLVMPYDHDTYWPALVQTCLQRRREQEEAFRRGAAMVGREEREWRAGKLGAGASPVVNQTSTATQWNEADVD